jgi:hypothetical protein
MTIDYQSVHKHELEFVERNALYDRPKKLIKAQINTVKNATNSARLPFIVFGTSQFNNEVKDASTTIIFKNIIISKSGLCLEARAWSSIGLIILRVGGRNVRL